MERITKQGWGIRSQNHEITLSFNSTEDMNEAVRILERSEVDFDVSRISDWDYTTYNTGDCE